MREGAVPGEAGSVEGRDTLQECVDEVREALASAGERTSLARWDPLRDALIRLRLVLREQAVLAEGPDGLFPRVMAQEPRLAHAIDRLRTDHDRLSEMLDQLQSRLALVDEPAPEQPASTLADDTRELVRCLLLYMHRSEQLVYEAYCVDVATGD